MKIYKKLLSLLLVLCMLSGMNGSAFAASNTGGAVLSGSPDAQPDGELPHPDDTERATLTADHSVRVVFVDWDESELKSEVVTATNNTTGRSSAPTAPIRSGYTFTGWVRHDTASGTATLNDDGTVTGITGPGPIIYQAAYLKNSATAGSISIRWTSGTLDAPGHTILNPVGNGYSNDGTGNSSTAPCNAKGRIEITLSGNNVHPAGAINIRIPLQIFAGRDGQYVDNLKLGVPKSPQIGEGNFNYRIEGDTAVISNVRPISDGTAANIDFSYDIQHPSVFISGDQSDALKALLVVEDPGTLPVSAESEPIIAQVITRAEISFANKTSVKGSVYWKDSWGERPADADDYVYYIWNANAGVKSEVNQPFAVSFEDTEVWIGGVKGEVVGYSNIAKNILSTEYADGPFFSTVSPYEINNPISCASYDKDRDTTSFSIYILTRFKKSSFSSTNYKYKLLNKVSASVTGLDDGVTTKAEATAGTEFGIMSFKAPPGDSFSLRKSSNGSSLGGADMLLNGGSFVPAAFEIRAYGAAYGQTIGEGLPKDSPDSYGQNPYTVEAVDDLVFMEGSEEPLQAGIDYEFSSVRVARPYLYTYEENVDTGEYAPIFVSDFNRFPEELVYGKFNGGWQLIAKAKVDSSGIMQITPVMSGVQETGKIGSAAEMTVPEGCEGIKISITGTFYSMSTNDCNVRIRLKPTERVKELVRHAMEDDGQVRVYNIGTLTAYNYKGELIGLSGTATGYGKEAIAASDISQYGVEMYHYAAYTELRGYPTSSSMKKTVVSTTNDVAERRFNISYRVELSEGIHFNKEIDDLASLLQKGIISDEKGGTFFELLPLGMSLKSARITADFQDARRILSNLQVETVENWNDTNRTMVIITYDQTIPWLRDTEDYADLKIYLDLEIYYSWESYADYGPFVLNSVAYRSGNGSIFNGFPDDGGSLKEKSFFTDLDGDGNPEGTKSDFLYAEVSTTIYGLTSSELGISKLVRGSQNQTWVTGTHDSSVRIDANSGYQYRLRYSNDESTRSEGIVIYDVLDNFVPGITTDDYGSERWKGTFESIDLSHPEYLGIKPVVYYSTVENLDIPSHKDLTDSSVWSAVKPSDNSAITAVAVDLSKDKDGNTYTLPESRAVSVVITMTAPDVYASNYAYSVDAGAFNQMYSYSTALDIYLGSSESKLIHNGYTKVQLNKQSIEIPVTKVWNGPNTPEDSVVAELYVNGTASGMELVLDKSNDWTAVFSYDNEYDEAGNLNIFEIRERYAGSEDFYVDISGNYRDGFVITNTLRTYTLTYHIEGDAVYGIPDDGGAPEKQTAIPIHSDVMLKNVPVTKWTTSDGSPSGIPGKWSFTPENCWSTQAGDYSDGVSELKNITEDKHVYGKWTFTPDPKVGSLLVSKTISGNAADSTKAFSFTVTLGDTSINGIYGDMSFINGVASFMLKGGESRIATDLLVGMTYTVSEGDYSADGYVTTKSGDTGTITDGETATAAFTNTKNIAPVPFYGNPTTRKKVIGAPGDTSIISDRKTSATKFTNTGSSLPTTGDDSNMPVWFSLLGVSGFGMISALLIKINKRRKAAHSKNR